MAGQAQNPLGNAILEDLVGTTTNAHARNAKQKLTPGKRASLT
jgi:hypothetical protein